MSQQSAPNTQFLPVKSFNSESGGPLSQGLTSQPRHYAKIKQSSPDSRQDPDRFGRIACTARSAAKHSGDQSPQNNDGSQDDIVYQQGATAKRKSGTFCLPFCSCCAASGVRLGHVLSSRHQN